MPKPPILSLDTTDRPATISEWLTNGSYPDMLVVGDRRKLASVRHTPELILFHPASLDAEATDVCRELRARFPRSRILALPDSPPGTAGVVDALRAGADDCLPFSETREEFLARFEGWIRRSRSSAPAEPSPDEHVRIAMDTIDEGFHLLDPNWRITYINRKAAGLVGWEREELTGRILWEAFPETVDTEVYRKYHQAVEENLPVRFEYYYPPLETVFEIHAQPYAEGLAVTFHDITDRKRAEKRITASERHYRFLFESNPQPVLIYDIDSLRVLDVNNAAIARYGYSRAEFLSLTIRDLHLPEDGPALEDNVETVRTSDEDRIDHAGVWRHRLKDGSLIFVEITSHPLEFEGHRAEMVLAYDVTERQRMEATLRESEKRFASFMRNLPGVAFIKDDAGRHIFVNEGWETLFDLNLATIRGMTDDELFPAGMARQFKTNDREVLRNREPVRVIEQSEHEGGIRHWLVAKFPIFDSTGAGTLIGGIGIDITAEQEAEEALRERERELRRTHEQLWFHVDNSPLGVVEWDSEFRVTHWSARAEEIFGWSEAEVLGRRPSEWEFIHPDDREETDRMMEALMRRRIPRNVHLNRNFTKEGNVVHCEWYNSVRVDEQGRMSSIFSLVDNVTDRVRAEREIVKLNAELEDRVARRTAQLEAVNQELQSFSYSVSHDLRAPLRGIDGFTQALEEHTAGKLDETARGYMARIRRAADRMGELIDDLLELSRISRAELSRSDVNLSLLAEEVLAGLRQSEPDRQVEAIVESGITVRGDPRLLRIVLENLLNNAWKFTSNVTEARIEFGREFAEDGSTVCYVRDNGVGFDMRYAHKLFGAFQRLHTVSEFPGTGIGLATVKRIIQLHGGHVRARGEPGEGASIYFDL